ncbi:SDR family oxidoreductase [Mucilaginibacter sp. X4EP1]|uniref:SDR family oxidoreductase n=1 Tax=Mucilaginibacter sp. X4EP1 TaxID=2723092 RepID=UPI002169EA52|nr:SDR family oxidoreductase [Mucilaginibacter sp. X4EP1]MCS3813589.1 NAD(P)-dependent dehydrogenase (short-subunit alcohol dehydrogenase family) [Mucilaginibacter sp. X4EP1]
MKKTIFITGASTGIGKATALFFAAKGWQIAATMRNTAGHDDLRSNPDIKLYALDVTDVGSVHNVVKAAVADFGAIDVLLNNAGYGLVGPLETASADTVLKQFDTNLFGVIRTIQEVLPVMKKQKHGVIINITSIGGLVAFPFNSLYHATKFGLDGLSESLKYELKPFGIQMKVVAPGGVITDFAGRSLHTTIPAGQKTDYDNDVAKVWAAFEGGAANYSTAELIAEIIYNAATDGTDRLRYLAGKDAEALYAAWKQMDNESFFNMVNERFGLA